MGTDADTVGVTETDVVVYEVQEPAHRFPSRVRGPPRRLIENDDIWIMNNVVFSVSDSVSVSVSVS